MDSICNSAKKCCLVVFSIHILLPTAAFLKCKHVNTKRYSYVFLFFAFFFCFDSAFTFIEVNEIFVTGKVVLKLFLFCGSSCLFAFNIVLTFFLSFLSFKIRYFFKLTLLCENQWRHSANSQLLSFMWFFQNGL